MSQTHFAINIALKMSSDYNRVWRILAFGRILANNIRIRSSVSLIQVMSVLPFSTHIKSVWLYKRRQVIFWNSPIICCLYYLNVATCNAIALNTAINIHVKPDIIWSRPGLKKNHLFFFIYFYYCWNKRQSWNRGGLF